MQYYFDGDSNLYEYETEDKPFTMPEKIKQMGGIENHVKIYMEDYVYTYLYQYGRSGGSTEKLAALIGRHYLVDGQDTLVISGAIQGKGAVRQNGMLTFSEETWEYIGGQMQNYFKGMSILGWVHCQPSFGTFLMARDEGFHQEYFREKWQVLFVVDTMDKMDTFYLRNEDGRGLRQARGYFIYYDKNREMQEYMLENSMVRPRAAIEVPEQEGEAMSDAEQKKEKRRRKPTQEERMDAAKEIRRVLQRREKEAEEEKKGQYRLLAGVCCVLCAVSLCMGMAMLRNMERLQLVETELTAMQDSYAILAEDMAQNVFAAEDSLRPQEEKQEKEEKPKQAEEKNTAGLREYQVEDGDSLAYISRKFYGDISGIDKIMTANALEDANLIYEGQVLMIP